MCACVVAQVISAQILARAVQSEGFVVRVVCVCACVGAQSAVCGAYLLVRCALCRSLIRIEVIVR